MTTRREQYAEGVVALLASQSDFDALPWPSELDADRVIGVPATRSLVTAFGGDEIATLVIHMGVDIVTASTIGSSTHVAQLMLTAVVRDPTPEQLANRLFEIAHPLVMAYSPPGVVQIEEVRTDEPMGTPADPDAAFVTMHYAITYQTQPDSLSA
jgi:hypothetical protein